MTDRDLTPTDDEARSAALAATMPRAMERCDPRPRRCRTGLEYPVDITLISALRPVIERLTAAAVEEGVRYPLTVIASPEDAIGARLVKEWEAKGQGEGGPAGLRLRTIDDARFLAMITRGDRGPAIDALEKVRMRAIEGSGLVVAVIANGWVFVKSLVGDTIWGASIQYDAEWASAWHKATDKAHAIPAPAVN